MIKDFLEFISEALELKKDIYGKQNTHFIERNETRLTNLKVVGLEDANRNRIKVPQDIIEAVEKFFQETLSNLANHEKSIIFEKVDIPANTFGLIRLGIPKVILPDGMEVRPIFEVYERSEKNKEITRTGKYFWIFTSGSKVSTIKLYNVSGSDSSEREYLIAKSVDHQLSSNMKELERIERVTGKRMTNRASLEENHEIILKPAGISSIVLNFRSAEPPMKQAKAIIKETSIEPKEQIQLANTMYDKGPIEIENVPKQMNVTPKKVWLMEYNEKFQTWGASQIISSKLIKGSTGNEIQIQVGPKWLHWLPEPKYNFNLSSPPLTKVIKKGDKISLGKEYRDSAWIVNTGTVTDISVDARSTEFPFVKTEGWDKSEIINPEEAANIFPTSVGEQFVLLFEQWLIS